MTDLTVPLGQTWKGFEFIKVHRYKRKPGFKITFIRRYWSGTYQTLGSFQSNDADEIIDEINRTLFPFRLRDEDVEKIREFCRGSA